MARVARVTPITARCSRGSASRVSSGRQAAGGEGRFSWLPSRRRDLAAWCSTPPFPWRPRTSNSNTCASAYSHSVLAASGLSANSRVTRAWAAPGSVSLARPNDSSARCRCLAISAARSSSPPSPRGTGRRTASATTRPISPSAIPAAASRAAAAPGEESQPTSTRRNCLALIAATPSDGGSRQPCQPPSCRSQTGTEAISGTANPRFPGPGPDPGQHCGEPHRQSSLWTLLPAAHKIGTLLKAGGT